MHSLPPLEPISFTQSFVSGDVTVHEGAAIAVGVLLQADPGSQLVIASGVCIGMGSVIHAQRGTLTIGTGANVGSGVLVIGCGTIGAGACIGSMSTLYNPEVHAGTTIAPSSLILPTSSEELSVESSSGLEEPAKPVEAAEAAETAEAAKTAETNGAAPDPAAAPSTVYGLDAFNQLKQSLFRH